MQPKNIVRANAENSARNKGVVLLIGLLGGSIGAFMTSALNVALPTIGQDLSGNAILQNWVVTSFILSMAVFAIPMGRIADIVGLKKISIYGAIIYVIPTIAAVFSNSMTMLIICRILQGIGSAMISTTTIAMITITYPAKERGKVLGIYISSVYAWLSIGPFLGGVLTEYLSWRSIFIFSIPFSLVIIFLLITRVKGEWSEARGEKFDYSGSVIFGLALVALIYGFSLLPDIEGILLTIGGILGSFLFLVWENHIRSPIIDVRAFRHNRSFIFASTASLINYASTAGIGFFLSLYLQLVKGINPFEASLILISQPVIQTIVSPFTGRLSDKIQPRLVASLGMTLIFLGLLSFVFLSESTSFIQIIITLIALGIGYGLFVPPNTVAIMNSVTPKYYAVASSVSGTMRTIGQTLSMGITLVVTAVIIGPIIMTPEYHPNFLSATHIAFAIFAVLCFGGILASFSRGKNAQPEESTRPSP